VTLANTKCVLIVDDAALVRVYYRQALEQAGYRVDEALNGLEALEKVLLHSFDLLIVDINMPQMDGLTFLRTLRDKEFPLSAIPVLVTSTEAGPQDISSARAAGANYYVVKPIKQETLTELVGMLCGVTA
jgi:two-component system, chemotaxis family, chemotaxis protein CheY